MSLSAVKTWIAGEVLFASDLNAEFSNIYSNGEDLATPATKAHDMNGFELTLDSDGDSGILADTDDRIDFKLQGSDLFRFDGSTASVVNGLDFVATITGSGPQIQAVGTDTDIDIALTPKGAGVVTFGSNYPDEVGLGAQVFTF